MEHTTTNGVGIICRAGVRVFAVLYAAALAIFLIGSFGLFGQPRNRSREPS